MPIGRLRRDGKIKPEEVDRLNRAFTYALHHLHLVDRNDPICDIVARKVIEIDRGRGFQARCKAAWRPVSRPQRPD
jgi:hypothetical protein